MNLANYPNLAAEGYEVTSPRTQQYNCIAFAAGVTTRVWWPIDWGDIEPPEEADWPAGAPVAETIDAFVAAFATLGYAVCEGGEYEEGFDRIAIYANETGEPKHAALQVGPDAWKSKLGGAEDIRHTLRGLEGGKYGAVAVFLRRPTLPPPP